MKLFIILLFFSTSLYAEVTPYAIEREDGGVSIMYYDSRDNKTPEEMIIKHGFQGRPFHQVLTQDIPTDRSERNDWEYKDGKVQVNQLKRQERQQQKQRRQQNLQRLGLTEEELKELINNS